MTQQCYPDLYSPKELEPRSDVHMRSHVQAKATPEWLKRKHGVSALGVARKEVPMHATRGNHSMAKANAATWNTFFFPYHILTTSKLPSFRLARVSVLKMPNACW